MKRPNLELFIITSKGAVLNLQGCKKNTKRKIITCLPKKKMTEYLN